MPVSGTASPDILSQFKLFLNDKSAPDKAKGADKTPAPVGSGAAGGAGAAPDVGQSVGQAHGASTLAAIASLGMLGVSTKSDGDDEVLLASIESKMKESMDKVNDGEMKIDAQRKRDAIAAKQDALEKAKQSQHKAEHAHKHLSLWQKVKLAFEFIGAVLTIAAGVITALTAPLTGGLSGLAGGLMIASGVMMLMMAIDQTMSSVPGKDGQPGKGFIEMTAESITKDIYPHDPDKQKSEAAKWTMGLNCALMGASCICGIVGGIINPAGEAAEIEGAVTDIVDITGEASQAAQTGEKVETAASDMSELATGAGKLGSGAEKAGDAAKEGQGVMRDIAQSVVKNKQSLNQAIKYGEIANDTANAGTDGATLYYGYKEGQANAEATGHQAEAKKFEALDQAIDGAIDLLMKRIKAQGDAFSQVLSGVMDALNDKSSSMSHVKFRG